MKVFIGNRLTCDLNYQHDYLTFYLMNNFEITEYVEEADILVFPSSCAETKDNIDNCLKYFKDCLKLKKPAAKTFLTGCLTREFKSKDPYFQEVKAWLESNIDYIIPHNNPDALLKILIPNLFSNWYPEITGGVINRGDFAEIFIGNGCLNNCAFCKLSFQNYPLKSISLDDAKELIDMAISNGKDVVSFLATNVCQFGIDIYHEPRFMDIVSYVESLEALKRYNLIGFSFKDAINYGFDDQLSQSRKLDVISGSLETGSPRLLEMINKGFTPEKFIAFLKKTSSIYPRRFNINIISGLPTETLEDVEATLRVLNEVNPYTVYIYEFINSPFLTHLNSYSQLSDAEIRSHTQIYESELARKRIKTVTAYKK